MTKHKRQKRRVGDIVLVDLGDGTHSYARIVLDASLAFYDICTDVDLAPSDIIRLPILFQIAVMDHAIKDGRWPVVGHVPLEDYLMVNPPRYIQDPLKPDQFSIYENGVIRPTSRDECLDLECAAVWEPAQVEDRLRDRYAGRANKWVESLKIK